MKKYADTDSSAPSKGAKGLMTDAVIGLSSLFAGGVTAWREILSESYSAFTGMDIADEIKKKHRKDVGPKIYKDIKEKIIEVADSPAKAAEQERIAKDIISRTAKYNEEMEKLFQASKFGSNNWEGFRNRVSLLNSHDKWKIGLTALAVTGISLGSLLVLTKDLFSHKEQQRRDDDTSSHQR